MTAERQGTDARVGGAAVASDERLSAARYSDAAAVEGERSPAPLVGADDTVRP